MDSEFNAVAEQLRDWFDSVSRLASENFFNMLPEGPHREAVVLDILRRNARILAEGELDADGKLYSPLCYFLAAACRKLRTSLGVGHWLAAVGNVVRLGEQLARARTESVGLGLEVDSPAAFFKHELDEVINHAALAGGVSYLDKENREIALGLSVNWGMRLLLAYALGCAGSSNDSGRKDLAWIGNLMRSLVTAPIGTP